jgi:hypothetical protein
MPAPNTPAPTRATVKRPLSIDRNGLRRRRRAFGGGAGGATGLRASLGLLGATRGVSFTIVALAELGSVS